MKILSLKDIGYEKNLSGPNVMSWTLARTLKHLTSSCFRNCRISESKHKNRKSNNWQTKYSRQTAASNRVRDSKNEIKSSKESEEPKRK